MYSLIDSSSNLERVTDIKNKFGLLSKTLKSIALLLFENSVFDLQDLSKVQRKLFTIETSMLSETFSILTRVAKSHLEQIVLSSMAELNKKLAKNK